MADRIAPNLYTQRGLLKARQSISIDKLNIIRNMLGENHSILQIQRAISMDRTATNKYVNLVENKMQ